MIQKSYFSLMDLQRKHQLIGLILFLMLGTTACWKDIPTENSILSEEEIIPILKDIHLAEAMLAPVVDRREKDSLARIYYGQVFRLHGVNEAHYDQSMNAYFSNPAAIDSLYGKVIKVLEAERKEIESNQKK